jgi:hypothetical protein
MDMIRTGKRLASVSRIPVDFQRNAPRRMGVDEGRQPISRHDDAQPSG